VLLLELHKALKKRVLDAARELYLLDLEDITVETPPRSELGDAAFPIAFELVRRIKQATGEKRNPRQIAEELAAKLSATEGVERVEVAGAGYLNVFFARAEFLANFAQNGETRPQPAPDAPKRMVEHTSINPNKAAHIGHVRNSVLGDTFVRLLRAAGERVEVQNYIDNTGVQVADVVVGFIHLENKTLADIKALDASLSPDYPFDYYCWDLYAKIGLWYRDGNADGAINPEKDKIRKETLHLIEEGDNPTAELADFVATRNVQCILRTMERLGIRYDVLPRESEILRLKFWQRAFEQMKAKGVIRLEAAGKNAGCWVMPLDLHEGTDEHDADKILVRSNGTVTYTGKDIAYQLWKLGELNMDFYYRLFQQYPDGQQTWTTTDEPQSADNKRPRFGGGSTVYNVIDTRQSYPQKVVKLGVAAIAPNAGAEASVHLSYEMVALSPAATEQLGFALSAEDKTRSFVEMSGRKGLGVKADDLINQLEASALSEISARHPDLSGEEKQNIASILAVGALRYFLLKFTRNSVIAFDFKEALAFEGETGTYCQNAALRVNSIFRKMGEAPRADALKLIHNSLADNDLQAILAAHLQAPENIDVWELVMLAARLNSIIELAVQTEEPSQLAKYVFQLAKSFNLFYHHHRIIQETDAAKQALLVAAAEITRRQLTRALEILGIAVPERM
jgi:arginyl-tRNA synthetase